MTLFILLRVAVAAALLRVAVAATLLRVAVAAALLRVAVAAALLRVAVAATLLRVAVTAAPPACPPGAGHRQHQQGTYRYLRRGRMQHVSYENPQASTTLLCLARGPRTPRAHLYLVDGPT